MGGVVRGGAGPGVDVEGDRLVGGGVRGGDRGGRVAAGVHHGHSLVVARSGLGWIRIGHFPPS